jgi:hypothetical protein
VEGKPRLSGRPQESRAALGGQPSFEISGVVGEGDDGSAMARAGQLRGKGSLLDAQPNQGIYFVSRSS